METINYFNCKGCSCRRAENEFEVVKGLRRVTCLLCKAKREKYKCEHNILKSTCKDCGGSQICEHNRRKSRCKECGGSQICEHSRLKSQCKECGGSEICEHSRRKSHCKECGGSGICEHNRRKSRCKECGGSQICEHNRRKSQCKECSPHLVIVKLVRAQVWRAFKNSTLSKINHSIAYIGCDTDTLKKHIQSKMIEGMTFDNIHYDHIKPVSRFDLNDEEELLKCCHFTNLQPLFAVDNLEKNNKWTAENEVYWNENIIYKPDFCVIYK